MASEKSSSSVSIGTGIGFWGAAFLSYFKWSSFWLALGHALIGWPYVIYYVLKYTPLRHYFGF